MFKIIDEKLGLASCSISDLIMKQVHDFLSGWKEGTSIGTLTLFYDNEKNLVVLNQDNKNYECILDMVLRYMALNEEKKKEFLQKVPESLQETFKVLNQSIKNMQYKIEYDRAMKQCAPNECIECMNYIRHKNMDSFMSAVNIFHYGRMYGKREERARRKRGAAS